MSGRTDRRARLLVLAVLLMTGAVVVGARLAYWQVVRGAELRDMAASQLREKVTIPVERGSIYDRSGTVVLATVTYRDRLAAYPVQIGADRKAEVGDALLAILGLDETGALRLRTALAGDAPYRVLAAQLTNAQSAAVRAGLDDGRLVGLGLEPQPVRVYPGAGGAPATTLASHLLGFTNRDGKGQYGVEQRYQEVLAGRPRVVTAALDVGGRPIVESEEVIDPGAAGVDLRLTIDAGLQLQLERELYAAWVADKAKTVSGVVLDPRDGAVLAWASVPAYDANDYGTVAAQDPGLFLDPLVSAIYEPGSVMKMFTAAAAYETGVVGPRTMINDTPSLEFGQYTIYDWDLEGKGRIAFEDGIALSRNIVAARVAGMLGHDTGTAASVLYDMWRRLGIGQPTGVDTFGEVGGLVVDPATRRWADIDLANRSFGQGMAVTQLQLAASYAAMVNGGFVVRPHVVAAVDGQAVALPAPTPVIDAGLSKRLVDLLVHVADTTIRLGHDAHLSGYTLGGKSGTAQIWDADLGDWAPDVFNFSFVGFVGAGGPDAIIAIRIAEAKPTNMRLFTLPVSSWVLFRRIAVDTVEAMGMKAAVDPGRRSEGP
jgi:cell division protein FtsI/penicillin-binding protein 2